MQVNFLLLFPISTGGAVVGCVGVQNVACVVTKGVECELELNTDYASR